uniref:Uncharacterized protein n=1 Tax=Anguilla anguilla TaxID=7936 RepID=A0A0E9VK57_ANGAN
MTLHIIPFLNLTKHRWRLFPNCTAAGVSACCQNNICTAEVFLYAAGERA